MALRMRQKISGGVREVLQQPVQLTSKPGHHWFGYFDKSCGNVNNIVLAMKTKQIKALPPLDELIQIGYINLNLVNKTNFFEVAQTSAWNFQQGSMLQWLGGSNSFIFNHRQADGRLSSAIHTLGSNEIIEYPFPIYSVSFDGNLAALLDFENIYLNRAEYG